MIFREELGVSPGLPPMPPPPPPPPMPMFLNNQSPFRYEDRYSPTYNRGRSGPEPRLGKKLVNDIHRFFFVNLELSLVELWLLNDSTSMSSPVQVVGSSIMQQQALKAYYLNIMDSY